MANKEIKYNKWHFAGTVFLVLSFFGAVYLPFGSSFGLFLIGFIIAFILITVGHIKMFKEHKCQK